MFRNLIAATEQLKRDEKGSVVLMFGLSVTAVCVMIGLAFDVGRTYSSQSKVTAAADAAALAAAKAIRLEGLTDAQAIALAQRVFQENMSAGGTGRWTNIESLNVTVDRTTNRATVDVVSSVTTTFGNIAGIAKLGGPTSASALFESRDIEVAVQLDLTGSMCFPFAAPCTNRPKIQGLKDATADLVHTLLDNPGGQRIRVGFAPFTGGVNLDAYQSAVTGGRTTADRCVYERLSSSAQTTDDAPVGSARYMVASDLQAAPYNVATPRSCPPTPVVPLTSDKTLLLDTAASFVADGFTGGHNGTAWTWNLLSPNFASVWPSSARPAAYSGDNTDKIAILMTDGEYNTINGRGGSATYVSGIAVDTCNAMKAEGIRVYTIGFAISGATAINTLAACASGPGDFYQAATPDELRAVFREIGTNIMRLRLTN